MGRGRKLEWTFADIVNTWSQEKLAILQSLSCEVVDMVSFGHTRSLSTSLTQNALCSLRGVSGYKSSQASGQLRSLACML